MGIAIFTASRLFSPAQSFINWLVSAPVEITPTLRAPGNGLARPPHGTTSVPVVTALSRRPSVVRVVRVMDAGHAPHSAGRMVISGRMADVCAELDRMVAREGAMPVRARVQESAPVR